MLSKICSSVIINVGSSEGWEQGCMIPFMSKYRLSNSGTSSVEILEERLGYRSDIQRKNFGTPIFEVFWGDFQIFFKFVYLLLFFFVPENFTRS